METNRQGGAGRALGWVLAAAAVGFASAGLFSSVLALSRDAFVLAHTIVVAGFVLAYVRTERVSLDVQLSRRWWNGLLIGLVFGVILVRTVFAQPASPRPEGAALAFGLAWHGVVYGVVDALLLTVVPVLAVYGSRPEATLRRAGGRWIWGLAALLASLFVTAAYHFGFAEFRNATLVQPLIGNGLITAAYLVSGSPLAPAVAHVLMHAAAVWHGMATTAQLPPHY
jgi:hypothetical protein